MELGRGSALVLAPIRKYLGRHALKDRVPVALATGLYLSYIPGRFLAWILGDRNSQNDRKWTGAGFVGTLEGLLLWPLLPKGTLSLSAALIAAIAASCWVCGRAETALGRHDDPRIVLDEVVGFWTAAAFLPESRRVLLAAFVLFRFFDSVKLPPYKWLERLPGGFGVVGDDVGAGLAANLAVRLLIPHWGWLAA